MSLKLYNTRTGAVEPLVPLDAGRVRIYVCGLTPSAQPHLGHARSFLTFDVLRRYLVHPRNDLDVTYVQNVTDIDDRSIAASLATGESVAAIVARNYADFKAAMRTFGVAEPDHEPYATHHIDAIVVMIAELIDRGFAYATTDGVYYAVKSFPHYGALSHRNVDELLIGARIAENEAKRDPLDFALWKFSKTGEPAWPSPWGEGRPGWHIECSAMARELLGVPFDIHGGGYDLIFPHHENEIAQSEALMPEHEHMANLWMHGGLLNFDGRKMSKSLGNFEPLPAMLERHDPLALRFLFLQTGYRKPMNFTEDSIAGATGALERLTKLHRAMVAVASSRTASSDAGVNDELARAIASASDNFFAMLDEDLNTSGALGVIFSLASTLSAIEREHALSAAERAVAFLEDALGVLGVAGALTRTEAATISAESSLDADIVTRLRSVLGDAVHLNGDGPEAAIGAVIEARAAAKKNRDFALADRLRNALAAERIVLTDTKDGTSWTVGGG